MIILFIFGLLLGAVAVIFALQNVAVITVTFFTWQLTGSLALILLVALASGVAVTMLLLLPEFIKNYFGWKGLQSENTKLREELQKQKELAVFARETPPTAEDLDRIEQGAIADVPRQ